MTKKHFKAIAELFNQERPQDDWDANKRVQHNLLLCGMADICRRFNSNFDLGRFLEAAGGKAKQ